MKARNSTLLLPFLFAMHPMTAMAQEYPSPMCHNYAVVCSENYGALGYASASACFAGMTANIYCPPPPDDPGIDIDRLYDFYVRDDVHYCVGRIDCNGPITPPGPEGE